MEYDFLLKSTAVFTSLEDAPFAGGVLVKGNRIAKVLKGDEVEGCTASHIIDCGDRLIMPGFIDAHVHYFMGAVSNSEYVCTDLVNSSSESEAAAMIKEHAAKHPDHKRIIGMGWYPANWGDAPLPTRKSLDEAVPDRPAYLIAADFHTFWVNTKALEEAGITPDFKPRSGKVGLDEHGEMNGLLFEPDCFQPAMAMVQDFDTETMMKMNEEFLKYVSSCGVTSLSEMSADGYSDASYRKYHSMHQMDLEGRLNARLHVYTELVGHTDFSKVKSWQKELNTEKFRINGVKGFNDGVTSTYTGYLLEPYSDRPDTCGIDVPMYPVDEVKKSVIAANAQDLPVRIHCIGDAAVRLALDYYEASFEANGDHGLANTIEHIESIHPDDIPRFKQLGVIPSVQPYHIPLDVMEKPMRIGKERCRWEWPFRSFLDSGAALAFGTDYPVVDFNPYPSIYAAVTRCNDDGTPACINMEESVSLADALIAYTKGAAAAYGRSDIGMLKEGCLADIIVVNKNLFELEPADYLTCLTDMTMFDGKIVFER